MKQYHDLIEHIIANGKYRGDRTGTGTKGVFGYQMRFDLNDGFPILTTKFTAWKAMTHELVWFISGACSYIDYLKENNVKIWDAWASDSGYVGPIYGSMWRDWNQNDPQPAGRNDQLAWLVNEIKTNPNSRRLILSAYNVDFLSEMALEPCHTMCQFYVQDGQLSCQLYQRSGDVFLGVPFNIASYALLTHILAKITGLGVGELVHTFGDAHLYVNHLEKAEQLLLRDEFPLPTLKISDELTDIDNVKFEHFTLENYQYHPSIKADVSV